MSEKKTTSEPAPAQDRGGAPAAATIGVRELKSKISTLVSEVREHQTEYVVTVHGQPAAVLGPVTEEVLEGLRRREAAAGLAELDALAGEIADAWVHPASALEILDEERR